MKAPVLKKLLRLTALLLLAALVFCVGCVPAQNADEGDTDALSDTQSQESEPDAAEPTAKSDFRILLTSDIHCTYRQTWYGVSNEDRMQAWVDAILAEHKVQPFDLIVIIGDVSLDYWKWQGGGSYLKDGISTTKQFMDDYVSQLPKDVPVFVLAGNHEQYSNLQWLNLTGNPRQGSYVLGNNLFLFLDSFADELDPDYNHDGVYTQMDTDFIEEQMEKYPNHNVYLIAHSFDTAKESDTFKKLVRENDRIIGLFAGHTHQSSILQLDSNYGRKTIAQTGNFSYTNEKDLSNAFWGFRDLTITATGSQTQYIVVESDAIIDGEAVHFDRTIAHALRYY